MTRKRAQKRKNRIFAPKTGFWRENHFWCTKCEKEQKSAKKAKMGSKTPKKPLSRARLARWARNQRLRPQKELIFPKSRTFAPKTRFGFFLRFLRQKEQKNDPGRFWDPKSLISLRKTSLLAKSVFSSKSCFSVK